MGSAESARLFAPPSQHQVIAGWLEALRTNMLLVNCFQRSTAIAAWLSAPNTAIATGDEVGGFG